MKSKLVKIGIGLLVLLIIAVVVIGLSIDSIIKKGVETVGPQVTKVDIKLDGVNLFLLSGSGSIKGLTVGNPKEFKTPSAIKVGKASLSISPGSLLSDKIVIHSINVDAPEITLEGSLKGNNLTAILANIEEFTKSETGAAAPAEKGGKQKKIQVDEFIITGAKVNLSLNMSVLGGKQLTVPLPDIKLTDLGKGENGITPADLTQRVTKEVLEKTTEAATKAIADLGKAGLDAAKNATKGATDGAEKTVKGIGDLFKKK